MNVKINFIEILLLFLFGILIYSYLEVKNVNNYYYVCMSNIVLDSFLSLTLSLQFFILVNGRLKKNTKDSYLVITST